MFGLHIVPQYVRHFQMEIKPINFEYIIAFKVRYE